MFDIYRKGGNSMLNIFVLEDELLQQSRIENVIQELIVQKS